MVDLDLDLFAPKDKTIKLNGQVITVHQPTTAQLFQIMTIGQKMSKIDQENITPEEIEMLVKESQEIIAITIPEVKDTELNLAQITALVQMIGEMTMPKELKELKERGVTAETDPKETATS